MGQPNSVTQFFPFRRIRIRTAMATVASRSLQLPKLIFSFARSLPSRLTSMVSPLKFRSLSAAPVSSSVSTRNLGSSSDGGSRLVAASASVSDYSPSIGEMLGEVSIFTAAGEPVVFKDLWDQEEGIAVVALLRHFGCYCSWELASALKEAKPRFDAAGVKLIAVGVGPSDKARILAEKLPFPEECLYADPDRKAYDVLDLYHGVGRTLFSPALTQAFSGFKDVPKNYTIKASPDDLSSVFQQGGMFVFKGKQLLYARKDERAGDHAPLDDILDVCCKAPIA